MNRGIITHANSTRSLFAAQTEDGDFIAFEMRDSIELEPGQIIFGNLETCGEETFQTESGERFTVFVEITGGSRMTAATWALK